MKKLVIAILVFCNSAFATTQYTCSAVVEDYENGKLISQQAVKNPVFFEVGGGNLAQISFINTKVTFQMSEVRNKYHRAKDPVQWKMGRIETDESQLELIEVHNGNKLVTVQLVVEGQSRKRVIVGVLCK